MTQAEADKIIRRIQMERLRFWLGVHRGHRIGVSEVVFLLAFCALIAASALFMSGVL